MRDFKENDTRGQAKISDRFEWNIMSVVDKHWIIQNTKDSQISATMFRRGLLTFRATTQDPLSNHITKSEWPSHVNVPTLHFWSCLILILSIEWRWQCLNFLTQKTQTLKEDSSIFQPGLHCWMSLSAYSEYSESIYSYTRLQQKLPLRNTNTHISFCLTGCCESQV